MKALNRFFAGLMAIAFTAIAAHAITVSGTDSEGQNQNVSVGFLYQSKANAITAFAGGGQASATQLVDAINRVTVVATAADSVKLPLAKAGLIVFVANADAADAMNVFPSTGDAINALAVNTALSVVANKGILFFCAVDGTWTSILTA